MTRAKDISKILTDADISGNIDVDGVTNLDVTDIDGTLNVQGETTLQTHLNMGDGDIIKLGDSADLQIQHNGSYSQILDSGTGDMWIGGDSRLNIANSALNEYKAQFETNGAVTLYHDNSAKIATSSTGVTVTGGVTTTTASSIEGGVVFNEASADVDFRVETDGNTHAFFVEGGTNNVGIMNSNSPTLTAGKLNVELAGVAITGDTDGVTMGDASTINLFNNNSGVTNSTIMILGTTSVGVKAQIASGIGFSRENSGNWGTQLRFYTHETDTSDVDALRERIRINSEGTLLWASTVNVDSSNSGIGFNNTTHPHINISGGSDTNSRHRIVFHNGNGTVGIISTSGSSTAYGTSSDYRLKENVDYTFDATTRLKQLKPCRFNFIADADKTVDGFLAHEVSSVVPEAISGEKDAMTEEVLYVDGDEIPDGKKIGDVKEASKIDPQGIDQSKIVPLLTKTILELEARITALESA